MPTLCVVGRQGALRSPYASAPWGRPGRPPTNRRSLPGRRAGDVDRLGWGWLGRWIGWARFGPRRLGHVPHARTSASQVARCVPGITRDL